MLGKHIRTERQVMSECVSVRFPVQPDVTLLGTLLSFTLPTTTSALNICCGCNFLLLLSLGLEEGYCSTELYL